MPSSPVHMKVAYILSDKLGIENRSDFLLGAISPDCVNLGTDHASEELRYGAHIRVRDYNIWKENLKKFYLENKEKYSDCIDYLKGYLFHMYTDIAWDEVVQPELFKYLETCGYGYDDMTAQKWQELYRFNGVLVKEDYWKEACELVKNGTPRDIATCTAKLVEGYRDYVVCDYKDKIKSQPPEFLSDKHIDMTIEQMLKMGYTDF